jgi:hypothetical protein
MHKIDIRALQSGDVVANSSKAHVQAYACLRHIVQEHITSSSAPFLLELLKLIRGYESV